MSDPKTVEKLAPFLIKLKGYLDGETFPLTLEMVDPSGNSFIKNPYAPSDDPWMKKTKFLRTMA